VPDDPLSSRSPQQPVDPSAYDEGYWERGEGSNYRGYGDDPGWEDTLEVLESVAPPSHYPSLLEVGCAKGWFLFHAQRHGYDVHGVDVSDWALTYHAPKVGPRLVAASAVALPFPRDSFSVVCSWEVLEHLVDWEIDLALEEMERVLRPGGLMVHRICLPGLEDNDHTHVSVLPREWWEGEFLKRGWVGQPVIEDLLDQRFAHRDWRGRFFAARRATE
jgi:ubiquinone/menaquinone biosynthesis C-methylase UbiE